MHRAVTFRATTTDTEYEPDQSRVTTVRESKLACEAPETALAERKTDPGLLAEHCTTPSDQAVRGRESAREAETGFEYTPNAYACISPRSGPPVPPFQGARCPFQTMDIQKRADRLLCS